MAKADAAAPATDEPGTEERPVLSTFDGFPVVGVGIEIPNASGGLNDAMDIDPEEFHHGDTVYVVLECRVVKVRHDPADTGKGEKDFSKGLRRVHVMSAGVATMVDEHVVEQQLAEQRVKNEAAAQRKAGAKRLPGTVPELDAVDADHDDGLDWDDADNGESPKLAAVPDPADEGAGDEGGGDE